MSNNIANGSINFFGAACIFGLLVIQSNCYAKLITTTTEINVKCSPTSEEAQAHTQSYIGTPNTYLSLTTKGMRIDNREELIMDLANWDWQSNNVLVLAKCTTSDSVVKVLNMFPYTEEHSSALPTLQCEVGQGIEITMYAPNDSNPNTYQYVANLTTTRRIAKSIGTAAIEQPVNKTFSSSIQALPVISTLGSSILLGSNF